MTNQEELRAAAQAITDLMASRWESGIIRVPRQLVSNLKAALAPAQPAGGAAGTRSIDFDVTPGESSIAMTWDDHKGNYVYLDVGPKDTVHLHYDVVGAPKWEGVSVASDFILAEHLKIAFGFMGHEQSALAAAPPPPPADLVEGTPVRLTYTNWRGETAPRTILPIRIYWGSNEWHPEPQWLIEALDCVKGEIRTFALAGFGTPTATPKTPDLGPGLERAMEIMGGTVTADEAWARMRKEAALAAERGRVE